MIAVVIIFVVVIEETILGCQNVSVLILIFFFLDTKSSPSSSP